MAFSPVAFVKSHPVETGAFVVVAVVAIYIVTHAGSASAAGGPGGIDPATAQLALQQQNAQLSMAANAQQDQYNLTVAQLQIGSQAAQNQLAFQLAEDQLHSQTQTASDQLAAQMAIQTLGINTSAALQQQQIQATLDLQHEVDTANYNTAALSAATTQQLAALSAQENEFSIAQSVALQTVISNNQTSVANTQTNATVQIAGIQGHVAETQAKYSAQASQTGSIFGFLGSIIAAVL